MCDCNVYLSVLCEGIQICDMHTCVHTCIRPHTHLHSPLHTCGHTCFHSHTTVNTSAFTFTQLCTHLQPLLYTCAHLHSSSHSCEYTYIHPCTCAHSHTTHLCTHTCKNAPTQASLTHILWGVTLGCAARIMQCRGSHFPSLLSLPIYSAVTWVSTQMFE